MEFNHKQELKLPSFKDDSSNDFGKQVLRAFDHMTEQDIKKLYEKIKFLSSLEDIIEVQIGIKGTDWVCGLCKNITVLECVQVEVLGDLSYITFALVCWSCELIAPFSSVKNEKVQVDEFITAKKITVLYQKSAGLENETNKEYKSIEQSLSMSCKTIFTSESKSVINVFDDHPDQCCHYCNGKSYIRCLEDELSQIIRTTVLIVCWKCKSIAPLASFDANRSCAGENSHPAK